MSGESDRHFYAMRAVNQFLSGARYLGKLSEGEALQIHAFEKKDRGFSMSRGP